MSEVFTLIVLLYLIMMGVSFASGLRWHAAKELWPHVRPWFYRSTIFTGKHRGRKHWSFVMGKRVIFRVPFTVHGIRGPT